MQSESARMSSAAEAKFRINRPNAQPRAVKVIALDAPSEHVVKELAGSQWQRASFLTASSFSGAPRPGERFSMGGWLNDLAGRTKDLVDEVNTADLVVMVATAGESACGRRDHRRGLQRQARDDHGAHPRRRFDQRRDAVENAGATAAARDDARDFERRRIHQGHAHGVARLSAARGMAEGQSGKRIVVVGGGPAGVFAAIEAKRTDPAAHVLLLTDEACEPYEKPPLSKSVLTGKALPEHALIAGRRRRGRTERRAGAHGGCRRD